jgi:hypothetical protein
MMTRFALFFALALAVAPAAGIPSQSTAATPRESGPSTQGLRIGISSVRSGNLPSAGAEFSVALENAGESDFVVNLGHMLANGKVMWPTAIGLAITDPAGRTRELQFSDRRYAGIAGRVDDFTVALRAGSTYTLRVSLNQYWSPATKEFGLNLVNGRHRIVARFDGQGARTGNLDMQGVALLNFWKGTAQSNTFEFEVPEPAASK